tara:strand:- start:4242 stop:4775 length:534 start_codon:yes stop_codon:yes gene_type:complete
MINITTANLKGHVLYQEIVDFIVTIANSTKYDDSVIDRLSELNSCIAVALDEGVIVGTSINFEMPADHFMVPRLAEFLASVGLSNANCVTAAAIFLNPAYKGQGIANKMAVAKSQWCLDMGHHTHAMAWGFGSQAIFDYNQYIGNLIDTGVDDDGGYRISLRTLQSTIDSLSAKTTT